MRPWTQKRPCILLIDDAKAYSIVGWVNKKGMPFFAVLPPGARLAAPYTQETRTIRNRDAKKIASWPADRANLCGSVKNLLNALKIVLTRPRTYISLIRAGNYRYPTPLSSIRARLIQNICAFMTDLIPGAGWPARRILRLLKRSVLTLARSVFPRGAHARW